MLMGEICSCYRRYLLLYHYLYIQLICLFVHQLQIKRKSCHYPGFCYCKMFSFWHAVTIYKNHSIYIITRKDYNNNNKTIANHSYDTDKRYSIKTISFIYDAIYIYIYCIYSFIFLETLLTHGTTLDVLNVFVIHRRQN